MTKMKKSETIRKALGITALGYQNCIDAHFQVWCSRYAYKEALPLAKMVGNDLLQNWYHDQWLHRVELPFYADNLDFLQSGIRDEDNFQDLLLAYTDDILEIWPQSLFDAIRRSTKTIIE